MNRIELAGRILSLGSENKGCDKATKADVLQEAMKLIRDYEAQEQANGDDIAHEECALPVVSNNEEYFCGSSVEHECRFELRSKCTSLCDCDYKNTEVALKCCDCKYCEPYSNPMCSKCFAKDKYVRAF